MFSNYQHHHHYHHHQQQHYHDHDHQQHHDHDSIMLRCTSNGSSSGSSSSSPSSSIYSTPSQSIDGNETVGNDELTSNGHRYHNSKGSLDAVVVVSFERMRQMMILNVCGIVIPMSAYLFGNDIFINKGCKDNENT